MTAIKSQRVAFGETLVQMIDEYPQILVLDGDLANSTRAEMVASKHPDHFLQMGIAEQNMIGVAAGLATLGFIPIISTFAVFAAKRDLDQIRMTLAQTGLHVIVAGSYCGILTGKTGKTHQSVQDLSIFRAMPGMTVVAPADAEEVRQALYALVDQQHGPAYLRLTRDPCGNLFDASYTFQLGKLVILREGNDITLIGTGEESIRCMQAADLLAEQDIDAHVVHVPTLKPLDESGLLSAIQRTGCAVTAEDHSIIGGLGSAVAELLAENFPAPIKRVGLRDVFGESAPNEPLLEKYGLTPDFIAEQAASLLEKCKYLHKFGR